MMAPESERAVTHDEAMDAAQALIDHFFKNVTTHRPRARIPAEPTDTDVLLTTYIRQQKEKDAPTLTCSEVVERLASAHDARLECKELLEKALELIKVKQGSEAEFERLMAHALATFAEKKNRGHLAELARRERRVQELEDLIAKHSTSPQTTDSAASTES